MTAVLAVVASQLDVEGVAAVVAAVVVVLVLVESGAGAEELGKTASVDIVASERVADVPMDNY